MMNQSILTLGGHSALEICYGAKKNGFNTIVIAERGRDKTYNRYYKNIVDEVILVDHFSEITDINFLENIKRDNTIFIPHRYAQVYCDLSKFEKDFTIPVFGNRYLLKYENREGAFNQYQLLYEAGVEFPKQFTDPKEIDRLVIVKVKEAERNYERAFFFAYNYKQYLEQSKKLISQNKVTKKDLEGAVIEEYLIGAQVNFNFFYSLIDRRLELLGTDIRRQTNIDGFIRIPSAYQYDLKDILNPSYIEVGHVAVTVKESLLEKAYLLAEKLTEGIKTFIPPGIIGPFALQTAIIPGPPKERIVVYDLSLRIPGSPGISFTPYSQYLFGKTINFGERIAMELKNAINNNQLNKILT